MNKTEGEEDNKIKLADLPHIQLGAVTLSTLTLPVMRSRP
jgi:hypothetical protein